MRKQIVFLTVCAFLSIALSGCLSVPASPSARFHMLSSADKDKITQQYKMPSDIVVEVGPVRIPDFQDRPQIVTINPDRTLNFSQFDRWGEPLNTGIARLINENLTLMLPGANFQMFPTNSSVSLNYQLMVDVLQFESELGKDMVFVTQWTLIDEGTKKMAFTKRSEFRQAIEPHTYAGLAGALSSAVSSLSVEIAAKIAELVKNG